jgi:hypothetical protein
LTGVVVVWFNDGMAATEATKIARVWIHSENETGEFGFVIHHGGFRAEEIRWSHVHEILGMLGHTPEAIETALTATETAERFTAVTV